MEQPSEVTCPTCGAQVALRISRDGFLQRKVLWHFGIYPWKCGGCGSTFLAKRRGARNRRRDEQQERDAA